MIRAAWRKCARSVLSSGAGALPTSTHTYRTHTHRTHRTVCHIAVGQGAKFRQQQRASVSASQVVRAFSNEDFRKTLEKVKQKFEKKEEKEGDVEGAQTAKASQTDTEGEASKEGAEGGKGEGKEGGEGEKEGAEGKEGGNPFGKFVPRFDKFSLQQMRDWSFDAYDIVTDNVREAYKEMTGASKDNLTRRVEQAESYRRAKKDEGDEDEDDEDADKEEKEAGPSALVHVKDPKSAWEAMKERLQDSPLIREILKNSRQMGKQAADTDLGKKAAGMC
jgi:hypothetical protein